MIWHRTGFDVDTHILVHHSKKKPQWLEQVLSQLENEPTNILIADIPTRNVGKARAMAMEQGKAPLLSFVDDDDWIAPGVFDICIRALECTNLMGVYTDIGWIEGAADRLYDQTNKLPWSPRLQLKSPYEVLHLHVFRRSAAMPYLVEMSGYETAEECLLMGLMVQHGQWKKLNTVGYFKRMNSNGAGSRITPALLKKVTRRLAPILLKAA